MTLREMYEGKDVLRARRNLSEEDVRERLSKFYPDSEVDDIIISAQDFEVWVDSELKVAVVYLHNSKKYIIIATGERFDLVE